MHRTLKIIAVNGLILFCVLEVACRLYLYTRSRDEPFLKTDVMSEVDNYLQYVNHSRGQTYNQELKKLALKPTNLIKPSIYIYSDYSHSYSRTSDKIFLLQGDSWSERLEQSSSKSFQSFAHDHNLRFIAAGTGSFSPSNMAGQINYLNSKGLRPSIIVAYVDQTDIGDEFCRYKSYTVLSDNGKRTSAGQTISRVLPYLNNGEMVFEYGPLSSMFRQPLASIRILGELSYRFKRFIEKRLFSLSYRELCRWPDIAKYLETSDIDANKHFTNMTSYYLNTIFESNPNTKVFLVTFPHAGHVNKKYQNNVKSLVANAVSQSPYKSNITLLDGLNAFTQSSKDFVPEIYLKGDPASHLTPSAYSILGKYILHQISY